MPQVLFAQCSCAPVTVQAADVPVFAAKIVDWIEVYPRAAAAAAAAATVTYLLLVW